MQKRHKRVTPTSEVPHNLQRLSTRELLHQQYIDKLELPTLEQFALIAKVQERKEQELAKKYKGAEDDDRSMQEDSRAVEAAGTIQRTYRGHRDRRRLNGLLLDPSTRWVEAVKEAQYRNLTNPRPRRTSHDIQSEGSPRISSEARQHWHQISGIARHARGDDVELKDSDSSSCSASGDSNDPTKKKRRRRHQYKNAWKGKMMDLSYFLEMVDQKHRYGTNLQAYHIEWMRAETNENFFYWLDHGEGRDITLPMCSRGRLDKEQVRYLSREERMDYLVKVDNEGRLCWMRNGVMIDTSEEWRDSIHGIVPKNDSTPEFKAAKMDAEQIKYKRRSSSLSEEPDSGKESDLDSEAVRRYPDSPGRLKKSKRILHVSPATILNSLMRKSVEKNTWIFVADISMNLYVGIKQSGAFQHSSFLHGSRISAAGLIKIKEGQIRSLSPLSGHYRPPTSAFRHFIAHLRSQNVDMSHLSISKSYTILLGLESYTHTKEHLKHAVQRIEGVMRPEEEARRKRKSREVVVDGDGGRGRDGDRQVRKEAEGEEGLRRGIEELGVGVGEAGEMGERREG